MSSVDYLKCFVHERLSAAAVEIFGVFERTVVQYEEEIERQRRLLENVCRAETDLQGSEHRQSPESEENVLSEPQIRSQMWNFTVKEEERDPPPFKEEPVWRQEEEEGVLDSKMWFKQEVQASVSFPVEQQEILPVKEEQQELCSRLEEEQLRLKEDSHTFTMTVTYGESEHIKDKPDHAPLIYSSSLPAESQNQYCGDQEAEGSSKNAEPTPNLSALKNRNKSDTAVTQNQSISNETPVICDICGKSIRNKYLMKKHHRVHTGEKPYTCKTCGKSFRAHTHLKEHRRTHTGEKPYLCTTCGKRFTSLTQLKNHIRTHTGERPYVCKTCGKGFTCMTPLKNHVRTHTGEKPYICTTCGKRFVQTSNLNSHMKVHTGEKPYSCEICSESFRCNNALVVHMKTHTVYPEVSVEESL